MKIGILTIHWNFNYGALLQAYYLQTYLQSLGHIVSFVNYLPDPAYTNQKLPWGIRDGTWKSHLVRRLRMNAFRRNFLNIETSTRKNLSDLSNITEYDALVCGSDIIWDSLFFQEFPAAYFLDFNHAAPKLLVSYAPSVGATQNLDDLSVQTRDRITRSVLRFNLLTVRDTFSQKIIKEISNQLPRLVVDPTMLIDEIPFKCNDTSADGNYILLYLFNADPPVVQAAVRAAKLFFNLPVFSIYCGQISEYKYPDYRIANASPKQFLSLFKGASFIITDSYHGTLFSIKSHKPFLSYAGQTPLRNKVGEFLSRYSFQHNILKNDNHFNLDFSAILDSNKQNPFPTTLLSSILESRKLLSSSFT